MLVTGGARYQHRWDFGGRVDGRFLASDTSSLLHHFGRGTKCIWDPPVTPVADPETDRPSPREGHTAATFVPSAEPPASASFGGKDSDGTMADSDVYLLRREDGGALDADST